MLIDLLSMSNYAQFNVKLAHMIGLNPSIYVSQLIDINEKAIRKNKIDGDYITVDREYITSRTTLTENEQIAIDETLAKIGVIERDVDNPSRLQINLTVLTSIVMSPDEDLVKDISGIVKKKQPKKSKAETIRDNLKTNIITLNPELHSAYCNWIDAVYEKEGWMTKQAVVSAQSAIDQFSNRNLDVALKILEIASINGYRDVTWAINNYKKDFRIDASQYQPQVVNKPQQPVQPQLRKRLSDEVF